jgi:rod shape-determining protein MreC
MSFSSYRKTYFILATTFIIMIFLNYLGWLNWFKYKLRSIFTPILTSANQIGVKVDNNYRFFAKKQDFFDSYNKCLIDLGDKETIDTQNKLLAEENIELKEQLNFVRKSSFKTITANVVGRNVDSTEKAVIINAGIAEGVKEGEPVIVGNGILVGRVTKTEPEISVVRLINDNQSKILATILNKDRSLGVVEAGYGNSLRMNFIPRNETVLVGNQIVTSGQEINIPKGLVIGRVISTENEAYQPFQQAVLEPMVDLDKIIDVTVIFTY